MAGRLVLRVGPDGSIDEGVLLLDEGEPVMIVGQATGRAINLLFTIAEGEYLYGVGTLEHSLAGGCQEALAGTMGGPFVGPKPADAGDWATCCCPKPENDFCEGQFRCRKCGPVGSAPPNPDPGNCIANCTAGGGDFIGCSHQCLQG